MDLAWILVAIIAGAVLIIYKLSEEGYLGFLNQEEIVTANIYKGSITEPTFIVAGKIQGAIEDVWKVNYNKEDPGQSELSIKVVDVNDRIIVKAANLIPLDVAEAIAGRTAVWISKGTAGDYTTKEAIKEAEMSRKETLATNLRLRSVIDENVELSKASKKKIIADAKLVGAVRKLSGSGGQPFTPFGSSYYRRPYSSFSSMGGMNQGGDSDGDDSND